MTYYKAHFGIRAEDSGPEDLPLPSPHNHISDTDAQADNNLRAQFAGLGIATYAERIKGSEDLETVMKDFLGDFMHLCDAVDLDFEALVDGALVHYDPETRGEF